MTEPSTSSREWSAFSGMCTAHAILTQWMLVLSIPVCVCVCVFFFLMRHLLRVPTVGRLETDGRGQTQARPQAWSAAVSCFVHALFVATTALLHWLVSQTSFLRRSRKTRATSVRLSSRASPTNSATSRTRTSSSLRCAAPRTTRTSVSTTRRDRSFFCTGGHAGNKCHHVACGILSDPAANGKPRYCNASGTMDKSKLRRDD